MFPISSILTSLVLYSNQLSIDLYQKRSAEHLYGIMNHILME